MGSLVVQTSFLGDVVLTTPLIAELAQRGSVDVVTTPLGATVLENNPAIRRVIVYDKRGRDAGARGFARTAYHVRRTIREAGAGPQTAYFAQGSLRSVALTVAAGIADRVGFTTSAGARFYTQRVMYRDDWHHTRRLLALAGAESAATVDDAVLRPRLFPGASDVAAVDAFVADGEPFIALAPGSIWATKRWPYFAELATRLAPEWRIALVGGSNDRNVATEVIDVLGTARVVDATGRLTLLGSAELIRRAAALVTNDSSPQHLASAVGTPTVTIFGPTVPTFGFGPLAPGSATVGYDVLDCRPCDRHGPTRCPLGHWRCMRETGVDTVVRALETILIPGERT